MRPEQVRTTLVMTAASIVAAVVLDYAINVALMPGLTPYTPGGTILTTLAIAAPSWWFVIGQRLDLQETRDALVETLSSRGAAEAESLAKSRFLATMSHELRTPLNAIIGYSEILSESAVADGRASDEADLRRVLASSRQLLRLIDDVLDLSNVEAGDVRLLSGAVDAGAVARAAAARFAGAAAAKGNTLNVRVAGDAGFLAIDAVRLDQCLERLLDNAVKFTRDGVVTLDVSRTSEGLEFAVSDTGIGIAAEALPHLFQSFVQVDGSMTREHGGAGVGLALTRRLARLMGGDVTAVSAPGAGSTFTLTLPDTRQTALATLVA